MNTRERSRKARRTDNNRLAWALRFAQADLAEWRDGDWLNALEDATEIAFGDRGTGLAVLGLRPLNGPPRVPEIKEWFLPLQEALRGFIEKVDHERREAAAAAPTLEPDDPRTVRGFITVPFSGEAIFTMNHPYRELRVTYGPNAALSPVRPTPPEVWRRAFIVGMVLRVGDLLTRIDLSRLRRCPECKRLFLAVQRQRFDTPQCSLRDRVRRFREKEVVAALVGPSGSQPNR